MHVLGRRAWPGLATPVALTRVEPEQDRGMMGVAPRSTGHIDAELRQRRMRPQPPRHSPRLSYRGSALSARRLAALALAVGGLVTGCGSSNTPRTSTAKVSFLDKGNASCAEWEQRRERAAVAFRSHADAGAETPTFLKDTVVPDIQHELEGLRALAAPPEGKTTVAGILRIWEEELARAKASPNLAGEPGTFVRVAVLAHEYGLTACFPHLKR